MTRQQAEQLTYRDELHHVTKPNADGTPKRCRVNGKMKTWKTRPNDWLLPVKHGLRDCFYIGEVEDWHKAPWNLESPEDWTI